MICNPFLENKSEEIDYANVFKTFFCYEIIEIGINQGRAYFVAECSTTLITESADRRPRDQFPVYPLGWSLAIKLER